jgi:hypothetical protein
MKVKHTGKGDQEQMMLEPWCSTNPSIVASWSLPEGKNYNDFFNPREIEKKPNTLGWPKFPHHKFPSKSKNLCLKYQTKGSCLSTCFMAHADPSKMESKTKKLVKKHLKVFYES